MLKIESINKILIIAILVAIIILIIDVGSVYSVLERSYKIKRGYIDNSEMIQYVNMLCFVVNIASIPTMYVLGKKIGKQVGLITEDQKIILGLVISVLEAISVGIAFPFCCYQLGIGRDWGGGLYLACVNLIMIMVASIGVIIHIVLFVSWRKK